MSPTREELLAKARRATEDPEPEPQGIQVPEGHQLVGLIVRDQPLQLDASMQITLDGQAAPVAVVHNGDGTWTAILVPEGHRWELKPAGPVKTLWLPKGQQ